MRRSKLFALLFAALGSLPSAQAAITYDAIYGMQGACGFGSCPSSIEYDHTTAAGSNRFIVLGVMYYSSGGNADVTAVTLNGTQSLSKIIETQYPGDFLTSEVWALAAPATGAKTVDVIYSGGMDSVDVESMTFQGVNQASAIDSTGGASGTDTQCSASQTIVHANSAITSFCVGYIANSLVADSPLIEKANYITQDSLLNVGSAEALSQSVGSQTYSWQFGGSPVPFAISNVALTPFGTRTPDFMPFFTNIWRALTEPYAWAGDTQPIRLQSRMRKHWNKPNPGHFLWDNLNHG